MIYLLLAILSSTTISVVMRLSEKHCNNRTSLLAVNYVACMVLAGAYAGTDRLFPDGAGVSTALWLGLISGALYLGGFVMLQWNIRKNGMVLSSTFMKLGVLVPVVMSMTVFREQPKALQICGLIIAVAAILVINREKGQGKARSGLGLVLLLLIGGSTDATSKVYEQLGDPAYQDQFLFYIFAAALVFCVLLTLWKKERLTWKEVLFGLLIGLPNYYSARFLLLALGSVPGVVAYPTYSVMTIVLLSVIGVCFFQEKISKKQGLGIVMILAALVLLNV